MTGAEKLAEFACGLTLDTIPTPVIDAAKLHLLDAIGVGLAASIVPTSARWGEAAARIGGEGTCTAFGRRPLNASGAALYNGALIHSLEYDDTHVASVVHGSSVATSAALAAAEDAEASGADMLCGFIAAWEGMIRLGLAAPGAYQARGFQISAVGGAIGAALAAARIDGLCPTITTSALGIAGSEASGLLAFVQDGASVKALHPGWAAHTGLAAVALAQAGMTGPRAILEGRFGFFDSFAGGASATFDDLGTIWHLPDAAFKFYPCCHYIHPFIEALEQCLDDGDDEIGTILCDVPAPMAPLICDPWERRQAPASGYDGKWGLAYCLAARIVQGRVDVETFAGDTDPAIIAMARRVEWRQIETHAFPDRFEARVTVRFASGESRIGEVTDVFGGANRPALTTDVVKKFRTNAGRTMDTAAAMHLERTIMALDSYPTEILSRALTA